MMDICTHDEVPKIEVKYLNWLCLPELLNNHFKDIEHFVDCYLLWYGSAGKCHTCCAHSLCRKIAEDDLGDT